MTASQVDRALRPGLIAVYSLCTIAGFTGVIWQPPSMLEAIEWDWLVRLWALFLLGGGVVSLAGVVVPRGSDGDWVGEWIGLTLVGGGVAVYGLVALSTIGSVPGRVSGACLLLAFGALLLVRWLRVNDDRQKSVEKEQEPTPPSGAIT